MVILEQAPGEPALFVFFNQVRPFFILYKKKKPILGKMKCDHDGNSLG
jgi:hypothetical protein